VTVAATLAVPFFQLTLTAPFALLFRVAKKHNLRLGIRPSAILDIQGEPLIEEGRLPMHEGQDTLTGNPGIHRRVQKPFIESKNRKLTSERRLEKNRHTA
jgi:hypothetical protein